MAPATFMLVLMALGLYTLRRRPAAARVLLGAAFAMLLVLSTCPVSNWLAGPLEERFPPPSLPPDVYGIVVLGGGIDVESSVRSGRVALGASAERVTEAVILARRFPQARVLYSGGSGLVLDPDHREADFARPLFESMGLAPERVMYERDSRNTWENAVYSRRLANPQPGQVWVLLTSARHMPRSVGCFRKAGWEVLPYAVDYRGKSANWLHFDADTQLSRVTQAEREWIGLIAYRLLGRTDSWFPSPEQAAVK